MEYTCEEVKNKFVKEGYSENESKSMLNAIVVEYNNLERNGYCQMQGEKLEIPDWEQFLFSVQARDDACGPYTKEDVRKAK